MSVNEQSKINPNKEPYNLIIRSIYFFKILHFPTGFGNALYQLLNAYEVFK